MLNALLTSCHTPCLRLELLQFILHLDDAVVWTRDRLMGALELAEEVCHEALDFEEAAPVRRVTFAETLLDGDAVADHLHRVTVNDSNSNSNSNSNARRNSIPNALRADQRSPQATPDLHSPPSAS